MAISSAYVTLTSIALYLHVLVLVTANNGLSVPANVRCSCPRELLVFNCTIMGGGITLWRGTAFNCPSGNDEIILRHSQYASGSASGECNSGAITGHGLQNVVNNRFTSQLNITSSAALNRRSIECAYNDGHQTSHIGISTLTVITDQYQPLEFVRLTAASSVQLTFEWSPVSPDCPAISYTFITSNCGNCSNGTNMTKSICSPPQLSIMAVECIFTIQSIACGNTFMDPVFVTLKVPDSPNVTYIPRYNTKGDLTKFTLNITESSFQIAAGLNSSIQFYTWMLSQATVEGPCTTSDNVSDFTCVDGICSFEVIFPLSSCSSRLAQDGVTVSVSATNQLGSGPTSDNHTIGGSNQFVAVTFNPNSNTFTCSFLNQQDTSRKSCSITYRFIPQNLTLYAANDSSASFTVTVTLRDDVQKERQIYFNVSASNSTFTLIVEGSQNLGPPSELDVVSVICGVIFGLLLLCGVLTLVIVAFLLLFKKRKSTCNSDNISEHFVAELKDTSTASIVNNKQLESGVPPSAGSSLDPSFTPLSSTLPHPHTVLTPPPSSTPPGRFMVLEVDNDCELKEFVEKKNLTFKRGCCFYQFTHDVEKISDSQEVVLMKKKTRKFVTGPDVYDKLSGIAPDEEVKCPHSSKYKVFVQSRGSGARHLSADSLLLYEAPSSAETCDSKQIPLMRVLKERTQLNQLAESITFQEVCKKYKLKFPSDSVFLDVQSLKNYHKDILDVILLDNGTGELFTGPGAKTIANKIMESDGTASNNETQISGNQKWTVFILSKFPGNLHLEEGTLVLRKNTLCASQQFLLLEVDKDCVQMSKFVESKGRPFQNGRAYYEFVRDEEDILDDTDVVLMDKETGTVLSGPDVRYQIPQAPGTQIKRPDLKKYKVFVQSKSQGSRCLRARTAILYNVSSIENEYLHK